MCSARVVAVQSAPKGQESLGLAQGDLSDSSGRCCCALLCITSVLCISERCAQAVLASTCAARRPVRAACGVASCSTAHMIHAAAICLPCCPATMLHDHAPHPATCTSHPQPNRLAQMTATRKGVKCDLVNAISATMFNYTLKGLSFQGSPLMSDGVTHQMYLGTSGMYPNFEIKPGPPAPPASPPSPPVPPPGPPPPSPAPPPPPPGERLLDMLTCCSWQGLPVNHNQVATTPLALQLLSAAAAMRK